ncbi:hypothetical protein CDG77_06660 [Nostoc sp. 'Peltigera membranacea cyanobiont' 213]|uniref:site-specific integrase n=1 Tax=unclassified Nostoc TaxID=2593658 RepID=UPI000B95359F|nr:MULTISPECIES: site-specific integrase [unclassified Nostoc]OYD98324.1 hypothetical protein CDG77_06660 [Nostoc sp. 'Peltigera membranacea cyanobiont' 213]
MEERQKKLLEQVQDKIRLQHYCYQTERSDTDWIKHYICFYDRYHPKYMVSAEIEAFLTHLTVKKNVAALTQNQALKSFALL